jgi:hypothetical protein
MAYFMGWKKLQDVHPFDDLHDFFYRFGGGVEELFFFLVQGNFDDLLDTILS